MKKIEGILMVLLMLVQLFIMGALVVGFVSLLLEQTSMVLKIIACVAGFTGVFYIFRYLYSKSERLQRIGGTAAKIVESILNVVIPLGIAIVGLWILGAMAYSFLHLIYG